MIDHYLITGASSGIGLALAHRLIERKARLTILSRTRPEINSPLINFMRCDLADLDQLDGMLERVLLEPSFNGFLNCAGAGDFGSIEEFSAPRIRRLIDVNLVSTVLICRKIIPLLKRNGCGDIVFIGSEAALKGGKRGAVYCASKFAVRGLAQSLREECSAAGVRVSLINPGMVDTPFYEALDFAPGEPEQQHIRAEDVARLILSVLDLPQGTNVDEINLAPLKKVIRKK